MKEKIEVGRRVVVKNSSDWFQFEGYVVAVSESFYKVREIKNDIFPALMKIKLLHEVWVEKSRVEAID